ncbi:hypothetical protein TI05_09665 [Achromatium sp. WMS3]|nr:hypothetical protein TI05_09665 [Achromatium sp. WMS3]
MLKIRFYIVIILELNITIAPVVTYADSFNPIRMVNPSNWFDNRDNYYDREYPPVPPPGYGIPYHAVPITPVPVTPAIPVTPTIPITQGVPVTPVPITPNVPGYGYYPNYATPGTLVAPAYPTTTSPYNSNNYYGNYSNTPNYPASASPKQSPSRAEMAHRIKQLEERLEDMEAKNRQAVQAPQPVSPPPTSYQYYSGDQTPQATTQYPFRPLNNKR